MAVISRFFAVTALCLSSLVSIVAAHPGEHHDNLEIIQEIRARSIEFENQQRELQSACENNEEAQARKERAYARRAATVQRLRKERGLEDEPILHRRTLAQFKNWQSKGHDRTATHNYNMSTPTSVLFGSNTSCILTPDNANGPYYVLGEHIRTDVREGQPGIPLHLEMQFTEVSNCKPAVPLVVDIWSCNASGIYSGVSGAGQGGLKTTFLRGVQETDADGVVSFDSIFPGHYSGRASHEHILTHSGATILPNKTFSGGHVSHLSQLFFDPALIDAVEATDPYNKNRIARTSNDADGYTGYAATSAYDPFAEYIMLGSKLSDGLFMWADLGIKSTNNWDTYGTHAAVLGADGGKDNPKFNMGIVGTPPNTHG
ncbi:Intradiol ring-cleavage dioxygenase [Cadophora sp. MPI-SDFR-AT-0126]|nr:Intradiol ring-cleavage dioxygenase [Leotiomycetes sp. MPI-SDFR-AT-0126]